MRLYLSLIVPLSLAALWSSSGPALQDPMLAARTLGDSAAPLTIWEVADFACPACRYFHDEVTPTLHEEYVATGKAKLVFINFPIPSLHPNAPAAHEFAMCSAEQDRFWPVHDLLYRNQDAWTELEQPGEYFALLGDSAGLDAAALADCFERGTMRLLIEAEGRSAFEAGIRSTPSFVIGGILIPGAAPIDALRPLLDSLLAE